MPLARRFSSIVNSSSKAAEPRQFNLDKCKRLRRSENEADGFEPRTTVHVVDVSLSRLTGATSFIVLDTASESDRPVIERLSSMSPSNVAEVKLKVSSFVMLLLQESLAEVKDDIRASGQSELVVKVTEEA